MRQRGSKLQVDIPVIIVPALDIQHGGDKLNAPLQRPLELALLYSAHLHTANFFQYNDEAILKVLKMGEVTPQNIKDMKEAGAILLEDGGDIQWLIKEVADTPSIKGTSCQ